MRVAICAATEREILPFIQLLLGQKKSNYENATKYGSIEIFILITGVGSVATAVKCTKLIHSQDIDLTINAGIAGSFNRELNIGDTCMVVRDRFGDLGTSHADGTFSDIYDMGLEDANNVPFQDGWLRPSPSQYIPNRWLEVSGVTVNKVTGHAQAIEEISNKYQADIESMEGAGFFYATMLAGVDALQLRTISNYVTPRDKNLWNIPLAIENLNKELIQIIDELAR